MKSRITNGAALRSGFTLIELLTVIAIIALLAGLIVGGAGIASAKMRRARVEAEREQIINVIERYKKAKGFYPPDNPNTGGLFPTTYSYQNSLFYELTGTTPSGSSTVGGMSFRSPVSGETLTSAQLTSYLGIGDLAHPGGFLNSSADPTLVANYFAGLKANQHAIVNGPASAITGGATFSVLGVEVPGPLELQPTTASGAKYINPWHYVVSNPTNNANSYDLWMDVLWSGKTNRVSNWSRDPVALP